MNYNNVLNLAVQRCEHIYNYKWQKFYDIYPFTTENISGYINYFDLNRKSLLAVGSSGDQILNAILMNCKDITLLDINPFVRYYYFLKMASILELDMDKYLAFFRYIDYPVLFEDNENVYDKDIFNKIKLTLRVIDYESYIFWDYLFGYFNSLTIRNRLFSMEESRNETIIGSNNYLQSNDNYELLRSKIKKVSPTFINDDILNYNCNSNYDNVWLSNIPTYFKNNSMIKTTINKYYSLLNEDGQLLYSYLYETHNRYQKYSRKPIIYNLDNFFSKYKDYNPELISFNGVLSLANSYDKCKDSILVLTKK